MYMLSFLPTVPTVVTNGCWLGTAGAGRPGAGHALQVLGGHARLVGDWVRHRQLGGVAVLPQFVKGCLVDDRCYAGIRICDLFLR